jgi:hypothetical protein
MARKDKVREHNEWFRTVSLGDRKSCPTCSKKLPKGESVWSWGEYVRARWRTVMHFCVECFPTHVQVPLTDHVDGCGCKINLVGYGGEKLPAWLTLLVTTRTEVCRAGETADR